jgi:hypothetical protein
MSCRRFPLSSVHDTLPIGRWPQVVIFRKRPELTGRAFARILLKADAHHPISDVYERDHLPGKHWWSSQQEHLVAWLNEVDGPGAYDRVSRGLGARHAYMHFQCAPGLLWIAEALGENSVVVQHAAEVAAGVGRPGTQCAAIRRVIPWERIETLALKYR